MSINFATSVRPFFTFLLGMVATLLVVAVHLANWDRRAELQALDFRFSRLSTAPENDQIVHVDIDDRSLEELGRWPWPRARLGGIVDVLNRSGAKTVALDIIMPEPQPRRYVAEETELLTAETGALLGDAPPRAVFDDSDLRQKMLEYSNVFLPMHIDLSTPASHALEVRVGKVMQAQESVDFQTVVRSVLSDLPPDTHTEELDLVQRAYLRFRGLRALARFAIPAGEIVGYPARPGTI
ncbi:MAG: CHASE2 domain-containing protein, partial [Planctomycetota bacterium]